MGDNKIQEFEEHEIVELQNKAKEYDIIVNKMESFYDENDIEYSEDINLCDIGEWFCTHFGYI